MTGIALSQDVDAVSFCIQGVSERPQGQDISMKKVCESNKTDSHTQVGVFSLCHMAITIASLKCLGPCGCPGWGGLSPLLTHFIPTFTPYATVSLLHRRSVARSCHVHDCSDRTHGPVALRSGETSSQ